MKQEIKIQHYSVITFVAPTHSGKSTLVQQIANSCLNNDVTCKIVSSDEIRRDLLCKDSTYNIRSKESQIVNDLTFDILYKMVESYITYPANVQVVLVDTTGLDHNFRIKIKDLCIKHQYINQLIVLNPDPKIVIPRIKDPVMVDVFKRHLKQLNEGVIPYIKDVKPSPVIINTGDESINFEFVDKQLYESTLIQTPCAVIGDVHESIKELILLVDKLNALVPKPTIYLLGDFVDKGGNTREVIDWLTDHPEIKLVIGNHENYVYKAINGQLSSRDDKEAEYFTSVATLDFDPVYKLKFNKLREACLPFIQIRSHTLNMIATHSPCENKYLGKLDKTSLTNQMKQRFRRDKTIISQLMYLFDQANKHQPLHLFGHVSFYKKESSYLNKIGIDNGCVDGGSLCAVYFKDITSEPKYIYQKSLIQNYDQKLNLFTKPPTHDMSMIGTEKE